MTHLEGFPLPATSSHDKHGRHVPPHIPEWRRAATPGTYGYDPNRVVRGREIERDQRQKAAYSRHMAEHRSRGESADEVPWDQHETD